MPLAMVNVDHADRPALIHQRHRQERFVGVLHQRGKHLEAGIGGGVGGERHRRLVLRHPAGDAFAHLHAQIAQFGGVRHQGGAQDKLTGLLFHQIHQTRVAPGNLRRQARRSPRASRPATIPSLQSGLHGGKRRLADHAVPSTSDAIILSSVSSATSPGPIKTFYGLNQHGVP